MQVPFCEDKSVQLFRVAFFRSDFLQNPYFSCFIVQNSIIQEVDSQNVIRILIIKAAVIFHFKLKLKTSSFKTILFFAIVCWNVSATEFLTINQSNKIADQLKIHTHTRAVAGKSQSCFAHGWYTVFPHIVAAATILFWKFKWGKYSREETIVFLLFVKKKDINRYCFISCNLDQANWFLLSKDCWN